METHFPLEEMRGSPPMPGGPRVIAGVERLHAPGEVGPRRLEEEVEGIGHEDEADHQPTRPRPDPLQVVDEPAVVGIVVDDVLVGVAASHDVVDRAGIVDAESTGIVPR